MTANTPQTVTRLHVTNFKRISGLDVEPEGDAPTVLITGENGAGKSSVLDAIETALTGVDRKRTPRPIHEGSDRARIELETQDYNIVRTFTGKDDGSTSSSLAVTAKDGAKYSSPQKFVDDLLGSVSVDPGEFADLPPAKQREVLLNIVKLPFDLAEHEAKRAEAYAQRTEANRRVRALTAQLDASTESLPDENEPTEEQSVTELLAVLKGYERDQSNALRARQRVERARLDVAQLEEKLRMAREELVDAEQDHEAHPAPLDAELSGARAQLEGLDDFNRRARANAAALSAHSELYDALSEADDEAETLDAQVRQLEAEKYEALAAAQFPVDGLGFAAEGIVYNGVPFEQASTAERIKVSFAVATSQAGALRVVMIRRGESLDRASLELIGKLAAERGFQVWIEKVSEVRELGVWHLEDGELAV